MKRFYLFLVLMGGFASMFTARVTAQTFTVLYSFSAVAPNRRFFETNSDGGYPQAGLILTGNTLYGTAGYGGTNGTGTMFALNTNGSNFITLHTFTAVSGLYSTNGDGFEPQAGLILTGNTLYGTTLGGGTNGSGTVFAVNTDGTGFASLYSFTAMPSSSPRINSDGALPYAGLILSGNTLYGTAQEGGTNGSGTVFSVSTNGSNFVTLHNFSAEMESQFRGTNGDGAVPYAGLILSGNTLYGTAFVGGTNGNGTVFALNTDGSNFVDLHDFSDNTTNQLFFETNGDGYNVQGGLILSGNTLYGTASNGGTNGSGTVFSVSTSGSNFITLYNFSAEAANHLGINTNSDGAQPYAGLILSGSTLYGTASGGGTNGSGTVFSVSTNGSNFITLYNFSAEAANHLGINTNSDGAQPYAGLILSGNTLYGTTFVGGTNGSGTVFSLSLGMGSVNPQLAIVPSAAAFVLAWPTNPTGFTLQSTTNLGSPVWTTNSSVPVVVNGQNTVTNPITGSQQFFRLSQ
jgi:uncharacterized repeat protein (TIGR03803 family)